MEDVPEKDTDVNMNVDNEQGVEEPPPRLMITKMVRYSVSWDDNIYSMIFQIFPKVQFWRFSSLSIVNLLVLNINYVLNFYL